jgi:hypothetical protein
MRIGVPQLSDSPDRPGWVRISARITYDGFVSGDEEVWFETRQEHASELTSLADPWLAAMAPLAAASGRPIHLDQPFDTVLAENLIRLSHVWSSWYPAMKPLQINGEAVGPASPLRSGRTGCFFSAGVDSFYSVIHDRATGSGSIEDFLIIHGADIAIDNWSGYRRFSLDVQKIALALDKQVVEVATNLRATRFRMTNYELHSVAALLAACALTLGRRYRKLLISSTWDTPRLHPNGSHPVTDPLFSTSCTEFVHHGAWASRLEKTRVVASDLVARRHLRVCWESPSGDNCGRCLKCLRTMVALELDGTLPQIETFPAGGVDLARLRSNHFLFRDGPYYEDLLGAAERAGRTDIAEAITAAFARTKRLDRLLLLGLGRQMHAGLRMRPWARRLLLPIRQRIFRMGRWLAP